MRNLLQISFMLAVGSLVGQVPQSLITPTEKMEKYERYIGSIYKEDKGSGSLTDEKSGTYDADLQYNMFTDALEYVEGTTSYKIAEATTTHANIGGELYYYCDFKNPRGLDRKGYYVLVDMQDHYRIYKKYSVKVTEADEKEIDPMTGKPERGRIRDIVTYYIEIKGKIIELPDSKKAFLAVFEDKKDELKNYMKRKSLKIKKEEDMVQLVARYNALKASQHNQFNNSAYTLLNNFGK